MKQLQILLGATLITSLLACEAPPAQNDSGRSITTTTTTTTTLEVVVGTPGAIDCTGSPLLGVWVSDSNPTERWEFYSNCTGQNIMCLVNFTYPTSWAGSAIPISSTSGSLNTAECRKADGSIPNNRTCTWTSIDANTMSFACNFHGSATFRKQ